MNDQQKMVREFHRAFEVAAPFKPVIPDENVIALRLKLIREETDELREALHGGDLTLAADAIADILYVTYGTAVALGIDIEPIFAEVHRSNMSKLHEGVVLKRSDGKVIKSPNYSPADIMPLIGLQLRACEEDYRGTWKNGCGEPGSATIDGVWYCATHYGRRRPLSTSPPAPVHPLHKFSAPDFEFGVAAPVFRNTVACNPVSTADYSTCELRCEDVETFKQAEKIASGKFPPAVPPLPNTVYGLAMFDDIEVEELKRLEGIERAKLPPVDPATICEQTFQISGDKCPNASFAVIEGQRYCAHHRTEYYINKCCIGLPDDFVVYSLLDRGGMEQEAAFISKKLIGMNSTVESLEPL